MFYKIYGGISSGLDSKPPYHGTLQFASEREATHYAFMCAMEDYESYGGLHGYTDRDAIYEDPEMYGVNPDSDTFDEDVEWAYREEMESWCEYWAEPATGPDDIDEDE